MYRTHDGQVINTDLNGAGNILRTAFPDIFKGADFAFLQDILIRNYRDLNKRIPVKGIGAVKKLLFLKKYDILKVTARNSFLVCIYIVING